MTFEKVRTQKIYEVVADRIEQMIIDKKIMPGEKLPSVQSLADNFSVGRSAVREALSALRAKGFVEMRQGEGTFVCEYNDKLLSQAIATATLMNKQQIQELLEVRKSLEVGAAGLAALRRTAAGLTSMKEHLDTMAENIHDQAISEQADVDFHLAIAKTSGNNMLSELMQVIAGAMAATIRDTRQLWLFSDASSAQQLLQDHRNIYQAIADGDRVRAEETMFRHLDKVDQMVDELAK